MDATTKLLESVTFRTLHANNFSRSSSQASQVLTDLLTRYLSLLTSTCAHYAQHAGRSRLSIHDALHAFEELGLSIDELSSYYETEGRDLGRYAYCSFRRREELAEMNATVVDGLRQNRDEGISLVYAPMTSLPEEEDSESEDDEVEVEDQVMADDTISWKMDDARLLSIVAPIPLTPVSNPASPPRKRARTSGWRPPDHIPDFLPPYPNTSAPPSPQLPREAELPVMPALVKPDKPPTPPPQLSASTSTSDYLTPVPYSLSSLSSTAEWHLPKPPSPPSSPPPKPKYPTPLTAPALVHAYHHVLTNKPPANPQANPARHRIAMSLLAQAYYSPRWSPADTLYSSCAAPPPRVQAPYPSCAVAIKDTSAAPTDPKGEKGKEKKLPLLPPPFPRAVAYSESITPLSHQAFSRIPEFARHILPPAVHTRSTKLVPPPALISTSQERLLYGTGIPAPWNSTETAPPPPQIKGKELPNGKHTGKDDKPDTLADARLYATWDWEAKDYRVPLATGRKMRMATVGTRSSSLRGL